MPSTAQHEATISIEVYVIQVDTNGFLHKTVHIAQRPVQNDGAAEVDAMPCIDIMHSSTIVLDRTSSCMDRLVKEAIGIRLNMYSINTGHHIDFSGTIVLDRTLCYMDCLVKEAIGIHLNNINLNRDGGLMLSCAWHPLINMLSNQKASLMQHTLDKNQQPPLASTPS
jgi:hypothetical protein